MTLYTHRCIIYSQGKGSLSKEKEVENTEERRMAMDKENE